MQLNGCINIRNHLVSRKLFFLFFKISLKETNIFVLTDVKNSGFRYFYGEAIQISWPFTVLFYSEKGKSLFVNSIGNSKVSLN